MKNQIFYKNSPIKKYYCDSFLSALINIQIQFTKALDSLKQYLQANYFKLICV